MSAQSNDKEDLTADKSEDNADFVAILASAIHDMKNSLGFVLNSLDEFIDEADQSQPPERLVRVQYEAKRVNNNLVRLLALYKMQCLGVSANIDEHDVGEFLQECMLQDKPITDAKDIKVNVECSGELMGYFDSDLVMGVLGNAVTNAVRYTKNELIVSAEEVDGYLKISVHDDGEGFPESMLSSNENGAGDVGHGVSFSSGNTGLGLYFSSLVAALHKNKGRSGFIDFTNGCALSGGCFSIYLP